MARIVVEVAGKDTGVTSVMDKANDATVKLGASAAKTSAILGGSLVKSTGSANAAVLELSRGIQDAPFGQIGYINNLQQFQLLFGNLVKETGSFGGALKSLGQSLIGPAGIGVAFSLVTSALQIYTLWQQKNIRDTKEQIDANDALAESVSKDIAKLVILYGASQNANIPLSDRKKLVDALQEQYPSYFKNLKDEEILAGNAADAYQRLTQELINAAVVKGGQELIAAKVKDLADVILTSQTEAIKNVKKFGKNLTEAQKEVLASQGNTFVVDEKRDLQSLSNYKDAITKEIESTQQAVQQIIGSFSVESILGTLGKKETVKKDKDRIAEVYKELSDQLKIIDNDVKLTFTEKDASRVTAYNSAISSLIKLCIKPASDEIAKLNKQLLLFERSYLLAKGLSEIKDLSIDDLKTPKINNLPPDALPNPGIQDYDFSDKIVQFLKDSRKFTDELRKFNEDVSNIINNEITSTFASLGDAIGNALAGSGNVLENLSASLLGSLGSMLTQLGKLAIATGVGIQAIKAALKTLNPLVAITAGVALVALGSAISKSVSKLGEIKGYANGTNFAPGGIALVGERGPEIVNLPRGSSVIPNHKISSYSLAANGGFIAETRIGLESLWIGLTKQEKKLNLLGT